MNPIRNLLCAGFTLSICGHALLWLLTTRSEPAPEVPVAPAPVQVLPASPPDPEKPQPEPVPPPEDPAAPIPPEPAPVEPAPEPEPVEDASVPSNELALERVVEPAADHDSTAGDADAAGTAVEHVPLRIEWNDLAHIGRVAQEIGLVVVGVRNRSPRPEVVAELRFGNGLEVVPPRKSFTGFSNRIRSLPAHLFAEVFEGRDIDQVWALVPVVVDGQWSRVLETTLQAQPASRREDVRAAEARFVQRHGQLALEITRLVTVE